MAATRFFPKTPPPPCHMCVGWLCVEWCAGVYLMLLDKLCRVLEKHAGHRSGMPAAAKTTSATNSKNRKEKLTVDIV